MPLHVMRNFFAAAVSFLVVTNQHQASTPLLVQALHAAPNGERNSDNKAATALLSASETLRARSFAMNVGEDTMPVEAESVIPPVVFDHLVRTNGAFQHQLQLQDSNLVKTAFAAPPALSTSKAKRVHGASPEKIAQDVDAAALHIACSPSARAMRSLKTLKGVMKQGDAKTTRVLYSSDEDQVVCWHVALSEAEATTLRSTKGQFMYVSSHPPLAKIGGGVLVESTSVQTQKEVKARKAQVVVHDRTTAARVASEIEGLQGQGQPSGSVVDGLSSYLLQFGGSSSVWGQAATELQAGACNFKDGVNVATSSSAHLEVSMTASSAACANAFFAALALQPGVSTIEPVQHMELLEAGKNTLNEGKTAQEAPKTRTMEYIPPGTTGTAGQGDAGVRNEGAGQALQSNSASTPLWDMGIKGQGQFVQVTDTGTDDASCWLRHWNASSVLNGTLNSDVQVQRSAWSSPVTDKSLRKVVQYIAYPSLGGEFDYDAKRGHGTHCAGTVAGSMARDEGFSDGKDSLQSCGNIYDTWGYSNKCGDFGVSSCSSMFCSTCTYPGYCDEMCSYCPGTSEQGVAPEAQLMIYDFGNDNQQLYVPSDYGSMLFGPAYDEGARVSSNSWGSKKGVYYSTVENLDDFVYSKDDMVVLVAASNDGDDYGDYSIGAPAVAKNAVSVGAAENQLPVDTVASFSSRGPTVDGRLKPDILAPGDPVYSADASGSLAEATCSLTSKSGTSMATPAAAGLTALLRQFLSESLHDSVAADGYASSKYDEDNPSAALLKAMLIASARRVQYGYDSNGTSVDLENFYSASGVRDQALHALSDKSIVDYHQGFGAVDMSKAIPTGSSNFNLLLFDEELSLDSDGLVAPAWLEFDHNASFSDVETTVTLVWSDPPASTYCSRCLVHDLDLIVTVEGERYFPNFGDGPDTVNNAEKVILPASEVSGKRVTVAVNASHLSYDTEQKFALVVTGPVSVAQTQSKSTGSPVPSPIASPTVASSEPESTTTPVQSPTVYPVQSPTVHPVQSPTVHPVQSPTVHPVQSPTVYPVQSPTATEPHSHPPTRQPSESKPIECDSDDDTSCPTGFSCVCARHRHVRSLFFGGELRCYCK